jgi:hypothetical protein
MGDKLRKIPRRITLYTKDLINITGQSARMCRKMLQNVRDAFGKTQKQFVTVNEFCFVFGLKEDQVNSFL